LCCAVNGFKVSASLLVEAEVINGIFSAYICDDLSTLEGVYTMRSVITKVRGWSLFTKIMIGFALGIFAGLIMGEKATIFTVLGDILVNLLQVVVAPLVFS
jgi:L-cystine uptake protein TcyP (sodium:dicarboxylate symporter family)